MSENNKNRRKIVIEEYTLNEHNNQIQGSKVKHVFTDDKIEFHIFNEVLMLSMELQSSRSLLQKIKRTYNAVNEIILD